MILRIDDMSSDIQRHVHEKVSDSFYCSSMSPLIQVTNVNYYVSSDLLIKLLNNIWHVLDWSHQGEQTCMIPYTTLEQNGLCWKNCHPVCTNGALAMSGRLKGFVVA